jgi:hypothetical protein
LSQSISSEAVPESETIAELGTIPQLETTASIPWYLRRSQADTPSEPTADIPDLPPNPPPLLSTLLNHIAINLGLDNLNIMDLRQLDPPPALGSKLIMIVGTARSEKHLHVSADRFCRWLRREHNLRANAAGLLGRNELKIKLRRKAKRMKMLANVGGKEEFANLDDGIRTGWICVTLGRVEAHVDDTFVPGFSGPEEFVGFREGGTGVNIVVQMFTEEKREEIDLERLWSGVLKTKEKQERRIDEALGLVEKEEEMEVVAQKAENVQTVESKTEPVLLEVEKSASLSVPQEIQIPRPTPVLYRVPSDPFPEVSSFKEPGRKKRWRRHGGA